MPEAIRWHEITDFMANTKNDLPHFKYKSGQKNCNCHIQDGKGGHATYFKVTKDEAAIKASYKYGEAQFPDSN